MGLSCYKEVNNIGLIYKGHLLPIYNHIQNYLRPNPYLRKFVLSSGELYTMINGVIKVWTKTLGGTSRDTFWEQNNTTFVVFGFF